MKKSLFLTVFLFPLFSLGFTFDSLKKIIKESNGGTSVYSSTQTHAEGGSVQSTVSTTVNGENVTVQSNQPGTIEVKNTNGKVEIKTSAGITPTIIVTKMPMQSILIEEKEEEQIAKVDFLKTFWQRLLNFFKKT